MKVVLFCGGKGMRIREYSDAVPKPMVPIGYRPVLWHVMKYYAHYGHKDFILCLGHRADAIKHYFLNYDEAVSNDFVLQGGSGDIELLSSDIHDWRITFVDTGAQSNIGSRLFAVREHLEGEEMFMANYSDGLSDVPLDLMQRNFEAKPDMVGSVLTVQPHQSCHIMEMDGDSCITKVEDMATSNVWVNGGYFIFRQEIFEHMRDGEELVLEPFERLIAQRRLMAHPYTGFWMSMDTLKDKQAFDEIAAQGDAPWEVWNSPA